LEGARRDVESLGGQALILQADVADADAVEAAAERVESELGPIEVWVNNAMTGVFSPVKEMTAAEFKRVTEVTYLGFVNGTLAALKRMLPRDRGRIIQEGAPGLSQNSLASSILREQARYSGLHGFASLRTASRQKPGAGNDGADAGHEHDRARNFSRQLWTDLHRDSLAAFALLGAVVLAASFFVTKTQTHAVLPTRVGMVRNKRIIRFLTDR
jgi:short chain dehydrogenase